MLASIRQLITSLAVAMLILSPMAVGVLPLSADQAAAKTNEDKPAKVKDGTHARGEKTAIHSVANSAVMSDVIQATEIMETEDVSEPSNPSAGQNTDKDRSVFDRIKGVEIGL